MNNKGYAMKEIIILSAILAVVFAFGIAKVSYAYQDAADEEHKNDLKNNSLRIAAEEYAKRNTEKFASEETFIYGSDLIEAGFLMDIEDFDYKNQKIKVTWDKEKDTYKAEVINTNA